MTNFKSFIHLFFCFSFIFVTNCLWKEPPKEDIIKDDDKDQVEEENSEVGAASLIESFSIVNNSKDYVLTNFTLKFKYPFDDHRYNEYLALTINGKDKEFPVLQGELTLDGKKKEIAVKYKHFDDIVGKVFYNQSYSFKLKTSPTFTVDGTNYNPRISDLDKITTFETPKIAFPGKLKIKESSELTSADDVFFKTMYADSTSGDRQNINKAKTAHQLKSLTDEGLSGKNINVAIYDLGIPSYATDLPIQKAIVYRSPYIDTVLEKAISFREIDSHGHRMAAYLLDYAKGVKIWDIVRENNFMFMDESPDDYHFYQFFHDENGNVLNKNKIDIISASFFSTKDLEEKPIQYIKQMIANGLVYNNSIGNENHLKNTLSSYKEGQEQKFTPYYLDFDSADYVKGAWVQVQAVNYTPITPGLTRKATYSSIRSKSGICRFYTICVIENGKGATSQATATFSGMLAMLMEYNNKENKGYTPREIVEIVMETADDIQVDDSTIDNTADGDGLDATYGHGVVNLKAALDKMKTGAKATYKLYQETEFKNLKQSIKDHVKGKGVKF